MLLLFIKILGLIDWFSRCPEGDWPLLGIGNSSLVVGCMAGVRGWTMLKEVHE